MSKGIQIIDPEESFELGLEGAVIRLRRLDSATQQALERRHAADPDRLGLADDLLDFVILDWEGVTSPLGEAAVPCTRANKLRLPLMVKTRVLAAAQGLRAEAAVL
ncbi:MAG: hypothetical protein ACOZHQ_10270 [Thermodesulfobacteriota bacterium]